jgi:hypothetical protein
MASCPPKILTRQRLLNCILVNQLATPGLGSILARRKVAGAGQLLLALVGSALITIWMFDLSYGLAVQGLDPSDPAKPPDWMWTWGIGLFGASWCWALVTSIALYQAAKRMDPASHTAVPPRIADNPGKRPGAAP